MVMMQKMVFCIIAIKVSFIFFNAMPYRSVACFKNSAYICGAIEKIADILKVFFAVLI